MFFVVLSHGQWSVRQFVWLAGLRLDGEGISTAPILPVYDWSDVAV